MMLKSILGKQVLDSQGKIVGKITNMEVDMVHGVIRQIVIRSGFSGVKHINPDDIVAIGDKVILRQRMTGIKGVETYKLLGIRRRLLLNW